MKTLNYGLVILTVLISATSFAQAPKKSLKKDFDTLGDNQTVVERVKNLDSEQKVRIVQNRLVDRNNRFEFGLGYAINGGGDSYVKSENMNVQAEFHINPRWSLGLRYQQYYNNLTAEGRNQYDRALSAQKQDAGSNQTFVGVDFPTTAGFATVSFYPIYGKLNLFDQSVAHFDLYMLAGYGQMKLSSGNTNAYTGGAGVGLWLNQRFSTRLEIRYLSYRDLIGFENRNQSAIQGTASVGILL